MLWRALGSVEDGFYIDVGAFSPTQDSVTKAFYDRGWHGINIEPSPAAFGTFLQARPRDVNLMLAVADRADRQTMYFVPDSGLSSLDADQADRRRAQGFSVEDTPVEVRTLASIWADHVPPSQEVHFLKIDVEGFERQVLLGNDWSVHRPWLVVVEATRPTTAEPAFEDWEGILSTAGYGFAYFDGLNRFYVADEHATLRDAFAAPPNVFDQFIRVSEFEATQRMRQAEAREQRTQDRLTAITSGWSWRATAPFRAARRLARQARPGSRR